MKEAERLEKEAREKAEQKQLIKEAEDAEFARIEAERLAKEAEDKVI